MNTLGKTLVALGICIVVFLSLFLTRDFGAPAGKAGEGFGTMQECLEDGMGASYSVEQELGSVVFDDCVLYITKTNDEKVAVAYMLVNSQGDKYYLDTYYVIDDLENTRWNVGENKFKTNFKVTLGDEIISVCDNLPVEVKDYTVILDEEPTHIRFYYNQVEKEK